MRSPNYLLPAGPGSGIATLFVALAGANFPVAQVAYGGTSTAPTAPCVDRFPYGPEQFLAKLLVVVDEQDPYAIPAKFQQIFDMKFPRSKIRKAKDFSYDAVPCAWYAPVHIVTSNYPKLEHGVGVLMEMGNILKPFLFNSRAQDECLSVGLADRLMTVSGWKGGAVGDESESWSYRKGHVRLGLEAISVRPDGAVLCVTMVSMRYESRI